MNSLITELKNENSKNIDQKSTIEMLQIINNEDKIVPKAIEKELDSIALAVDSVVKTFNNNGRLIYIGAGTSGRLGILDASECPPTYGVDSKMVQGIIAGGNKAILKAVEGAEDNEDLAIDDLKNISINSNDTVCGLAASGRTPYVIAGLKYANSVGANTISICCVENGLISKIAKYPIEAVVGAEVVTGSTRMKAGTAQKLILNMITTASMIKIGKVYGNLMVDVQPTNEKLMKRAIGIVSECGKVNPIKAEEILHQCNDQVKIAILQCLSGYSPMKCKEILEKNNDNVSKSITEIIGG